MPKILLALWTAPTQKNEYRAIPTGYLQRQG